MTTVKFKNIDTPLIGNPVQVGTIISATVTNLQLEDVKLGKFDKKYTIFSIFPSINTSVCDEQTQMTSQIAKKYLDYDFIALSLDLPTALAQWCAAHNVENLQVYSDYKKREFSKKYGLLIDGIYLMNRAILVVDQAGKVVYAKHNDNVHDQIDFANLEDFLNNN